MRMMMMTVAMMRVIQPPEVERQTQPQHQMTIQMMMTTMRMRMILRRRRRKRNLLKLRLKKKLPRKKPKLKMLRPRNRRLRLLKLRKKQRPPNRNLRLQKMLKHPKRTGKKPKPETKTPGKTPKRTIKGGIQIEDLHEGSGQEVKAGNTVGMFYSGRLASNNKKFDSCLSGPPFKFKLGKGEVIKGWDLGVLGIKVGGKRRLTIPPKFASGQTGAPPDIPPNSTLIFEIECKLAK